MHKLLTLLRNLWGEQTTKAGVGAVLLTLGSLCLHGFDKAGLETQIFPLTGCPTGKEVLIGAVVCVIFRGRNLENLKQLISAAGAGQPPPKP